MNSPIAARRISSAALFAFTALIAFCAPTVIGQTINTVAGGGVGDGAAATAANLALPVGAVVDSAGNLYIADSNNHRVRKVDTRGVISTVAGNGSQGFSGDGGAAVSASLNFPFGVAVDSAGNLYIADSKNHRLRKVDTNGIISTVAGSGQRGYSGDGGAATGASLHDPLCVAVDSAGNLYISDNGNYRIRKVNTTGSISTVAGNGTPGFSGDGGAATSARLHGPRGVAIDSAGSLYIVDGLNHRIRKVSASGVISTVAGNDTFGFIGDGGAATSASLNSPFGVAVDSAGNLYIGDTDSHRIRKVSTNGVISTVAGRTDGFSGDGGAATNASFRQPTAIATDSAGNIYVADYGNHRIRKVDSGGTVSTVAGSGADGFVGDGGAAASARLFGPFGVAADGAGNIYVVDNSSHRIRKVNSSGVISTVAGNGIQGFSGDGGPAASARLFGPFGMAVDSAGNLYIADNGNHRIRKVDTRGVISTVAGNASQGFGGDGGAATSASLNAPRAVAVDSVGNLYIADRGNHRIRKVSSAGIISTVAGNGLQGFSGEGGAATSASLWSPASVVIDSVGNLYIADSSNHRVRKVNSSGVISTVAGDGNAGFSGDEGAAINAKLSNPSGLTLDGAGDLYIADSGNQRVRRLSASGVISTAAGSGSAGFSGDGGSATSASLSFPSGVAIDNSGNLYIADYNNNRVRKVTPTYQGAWWAGAAENGWGLSFIQHGNTLAAGWYYFNAQGQPTWAIVPGCTWNATNTACTGNVTASTGSWLGNYTGIQTQNVIGTVTFSFSSPSAGTMSWNIGGVPGTKAISKLNYASGVSPSGIDYTDIWSGGASQNGWGVALLQQGGVMAGAWYTYNQQNQPVWYLINGGTWSSSNVFTAPLTRATGSPLVGATYNPAQLNASTAGTVTFTFTDSANASMTYTVDGVTQTKAISRLAF